MSSLVNNDDSTITPSQGSERVELGGAWLRVTFSDGHRGDFHLRWLRHNCDRARHPQTGERTLCSSELADDLRALSAWVHEGRLHVIWSPDAHESRYALGWLRAHAYALDRLEVPPPPRDVARLTVESAGRSPADVVAEALAVLGRHGAVVLRRTGQPSGAPEDETEPLIETLAAVGLDVIGTHFGRIEDLRTDNVTNQNTDQLGYTDATIQLHTDQPFLDDPPRYQLLQSLREADEGGDNFIVDAEAAFAYLASLDADAAARLRATPVTFHRQQKAFERVVVSPLVGEREGRFFIRYSYFTLSPFRLPFAEVESWYRAYDRFARLVRDPAHQYRFRLRPGDWLLYDNHRMLHARTGFRGPRWVRGVYFNPRGGLRV